MSKLFLALGIAFLLPVAVHAATADELRAQINELLARIQAVQAQITAQGGATAATPSIPSAAGSCPRVSRVLKLGDSGADVTRLQQFLATDPAIYPEKNISGYYGSLTEAAVKRFQCKNKIVCDGDASSTGYGVTGPRTAAIMALQCPDGGGTPVATGGGTGQISGFIKVTPTTGASPLNVTVEATVNTARTCAAATYVIDYGDGSAPVSVNVPANGCNEVRQVFAHVYNAPGTYQVLLRAGTHQVSATVSVQQGTTLPAASDTLSASPTSGVTPLTVSFSGLVNVSATCNTGPYSMNFGDSQTASISVAGCSATQFNVPHTYSTSGVYTARLYRGTVSVGSVTINAGGSVSSSGGPFSVTGGINVNPLQARATFDISSSCAAYDLDWGDGTSRTIQSQGSCTSGTVQKELTHTYPGPGAYTVMLRRGSSTDTAGVTIVQ